MTRDIEALDAGNGLPTGSWSDGTTLWVADNASGAGDAVYAYDLESGERVEDREFALAATNRAPRGIWSDGTTVWVSDSGRDRLFAYDLATGERDEERELVLTRRNRDPRGIWSDGSTMWVLNANPSLFAYGLASGELLGLYTLHDANGDPRGIWSDGTTVWVSDHGAKHLFAYRVPSLPESEPPEEPPALDRVVGEEFEEPGRVGNNSPRGIWSDGAVMYVADANDGKVYTYNMPDAIDTRLASLAIEGMDIGEFNPVRTEYEAVLAAGVAETTVEAAAEQSGAEVAISPPDADEAANGHQVALDDISEITVTVTSADGSRARIYRVALEEPEQATEQEAEQEAMPEPWAHCLKGAVAVGFSLLVYEGGTVGDLVACAESRAVTALYLLDDGEWVSYVVGAPDIVNTDFRALFAGGVPTFTPLVAASPGPASPDPSPDADVTVEWAGCLHGEVAAGFSLVLYAGGTVEELAACAERSGISAIYTLVDGEYVSYVLGAPEFVNARFSARFPDGIPAATPLAARSEGP